MLTTHGLLTYLQSHSDLARSTAVGVPLTLLLLAVLLIAEMRRPWVAPRALGAALLLPVGVGLVAVFVGRLRGLAL